MYAGYLAIAFLLVYVQLSCRGDTITLCDVFCYTDGCRENGRTFGPFKYCDRQILQSIINITLMMENVNFSPLGNLQIDFTSPRELDCGIEVTLYKNKSIGEEECASYNFQKENHSDVHMSKAICFVLNSTQFQNSFYTSAGYIDTACYNIHIDFGSNSHKGDYNKFIRTTYNPKKIKGDVRCEYSVISSDGEKRKLNFTIQSSVSLVKEVLLRLGNKSMGNGYKSCDDLKNRNLTLNSTQIIETVNVTINKALAEEKMFENFWNFPHEDMHGANYCILIDIFDDRCARNRCTNDKCCEFRDCVLTHKGSSIQTDSSDINLFLWIIYISLIIFGMLVITYFVYSVYTCNIRAKTRRKKDRKYEQITYQNNNKISTDIVLLYPKSSESIMALMADLRGMLSNTCQCIVHDWHDGREWNRVAELGGSDWFAEMLDKGSRVIWLDTPTMRSLIKRRFKNNSSKQLDLTEISDFRDMVLPTIFDLAKRDVEESEPQQQRHFIVRLKEFENCGNDDDDPFKNLSPYQRYFILQDFNLLRSDLSV